MQSATLRLQQSMAITKKEERINKGDLGIVMVGKDTNVLCCHGRGACRRCEMILLRAVRALAGAGCRVLGRAWISCTGGAARESRST